MAVIDIDEGRKSNYLAKALARLDNSALLSDEGRAQALYELWKDRLYYVPEIKTWRAWKKGRWRTHETIHREIAGEVLNQIIGVLEDRSGHDRKAPDWRARLANDSSIQRMTNIAKDWQERFHKPLALWDANPYALATQNCVVDLRSGQGREEEPYDLISQRCNAEFRPDADDSLWCSVIDNACHGSGGVDHPFREYLQEDFGLALFGDDIKERMTFLVGPGGTGKSTVLHAIGHALGSYANALKPDALTPHPGGAIREDIADCEGARFVYMPELAGNAKIDLQLVKMMASRDTMRARKMRQNSREIISTWTVYAACNQLPCGNQEPDSGYWRRVQVVPFVNSPPKLDSRLGHKLQSAEGAAGILAWLVRGCRIALRRQHAGEGQMRAPDVMHKAEERYRALTYSNVQLFIERELEDSPGTTTPADDLYLAYMRWFSRLGMLEDGAQIATKNQFGQALTDRGWLNGPRKGKKKRRTRVGVRIRQRFADLGELIPKAISPFDFY